MSEGRFSEEHLSQPSTADMKAASVPVEGASSGVDTRVPQPRTNWNIYGVTIRSKVKMTNNKKFRRLVSWLRPVQHKSDIQAKWIASTNHE